MFARKLYYNKKIDENNTMGDITINTKNDNSKRILRKHHTGSIYIKDRNNSSIEIISNSSKRDLSLSPSITKPMKDISIRSSSNDNDGKPVRKEEEKKTMTATIIKRKKSDDILFALQQRIKNEEKTRKIISSGNGSSRRLKSTVKKIMNQIKEEKKLSDDSFAKQQNATNTQISLILLRKIQNLKEKMEADNICHQKKVVELSSDRIKFIQEEQKKYEIKLFFNDINKKQIENNQKIICDEKKENKKLTKALTKRMELKNDLLGNSQKLEETSRRLKMKLLAEEELTTPKKKDTSQLEQQRQQLMNHKREKSQKLLRYQDGYLRSASERLLFQRGMEAIEVIVSNDMKISNDHTGNLFFVKSEIDQIIDKCHSNGKRILDSIEQ